MQTTDWPLGVNRIVTSNSSLTIGNGAVVADKSENGSDMSRLSASGSPDRWSVVMYFSNSMQDSFYKKYGQTEWDRFSKWVKFNARMGTIPFYFSKVGDVTNTQKCLYKIASDGLPKPEITGTWVKVTMTWIEVFDDLISIEIPETKADYIEAMNGSVDFRFVEIPEEDFAKQDFTFTYNRDYSGTVMIQNEPLVMEDMDYDGNKSVMFYFQEFTLPGLYTIKARFRDSPEVISQFEVE